jgi:ribosomal protein S18 acetylase RimI-like enzyme
MLKPTYPLRSARLDDDMALAELINFAGEGAPYHLWEEMADPGETPWEVGCRRARREEGGFSFRNAIVAEVDGEVAAALIGYELAPNPEAIDYDTTPPAFIPLLELENLVPETWYINVLAAFPRWRGMGIGTQLLDVAEGIARRKAFTGLSLIVSDANHGARRLYEKNGYRECAWRDMVKDGWPGEGDVWALLVKEI